MSRLMHDLDAARTPVDMAHANGEPVQASARGRALGIVRVGLSGRFSAVWALVACFAAFALATPSTFLTAITLKTTLADQAITGMLAIAVMIPFVAGVFDISIAAIAGFAMVFASWLSVHTGLGVAVICAITVLAAASMGTISGVLVARLGTNSLVTTLGMSTAAAGLTQLLTNQNQIVPNFNSGFLALGQHYLWVLPLPFVYFLVLCALAYFVLEHTPVGRRAHAVGGNSIAAQLAGIRTGRIVFISLIVSAVISGLTGLVLAAQIGVATESSAAGFLLPAIAALFLGATQIVNRVNVPGTIVAVLLLGVGTKGLQLLGADVWVVQFFDGTVLLLAVAIAAGGVNRIK